MDQIAPQNQVVEPARSVYPPTVEKSAELIIQVVPADVVAVAAWKAPALEAEMAAAMVETEK